MLKDVFKQHWLFMVSFALQLALSLSMLWDPFAASNLSRSFAEPLNGADSILRAFGLPLSLAATVFFMRATKGRYRNGFAIFLVALLMMSAALLMLIRIDYLPQAQLLLAFSFFAPISFGGFFVYFYGYLLDMPREHFIRVVLWSSVMSGCATLLMHNELTPALLMLFNIAYAASILTIVFRHSNVFAKEDEPAEQRMSLASLAECLRPMTCFALCALVAGLMRTQVFGDHQSMDIADVITKFVCPLSGLLLLAFVRQLEKGQLFGRLYDILFPLAVTLYLLLPLLGPDYGMVLLIIDMFVFFLLSPLLIISSRYLAKESGLSPLMLCSGFAVSYYLAAAIGSALGIEMASRGSYQVVLLLVIALIAVWVLAITGHLLSRGSKANENDSDPAPEVPTKDPLEEALNALQDDFGLSKREREVADFIARGRSVNFIAETLFISRSTVQSHSKSLYKKLEIHSKQELIDLVEAHNTAEK